MVLVVTTPSGARAIVSWDFQMGQGCMKTPAEKIAKLGLPLFHKEEVVIHLKHYN